MTSSHPSKTIDQTIAAIQALDLGPIMFKACRSEDGYGWTTDYAQRMEVGYKRYLILHARHPGLTLAPERDIDRFWHMHILDTRKYAADCDACFGYFLHHFPYLGLRGEDDAAALQAAFLKMQELYAQEFGEPTPALQHDAAWCSIESPVAKAAWCSIESPAAKAAWCSIEQPVAKPAWCSIEQPVAKPAWCSIEQPVAKAAWCSIEQAVARPAWCSIEQPVARAAWCSIEQPALAHERTGASAEPSSARRAG